MNHNRHPVRNTALTLAALGVAALGIKEASGMSLDPSIAKETISADQMNSINTKGIKVAETALQTYERAVAQAAKDAKRPFKSRLLPGLQVNATPNTLSIYDTETTDIGMTPNFQHITTNQLFITTQAGANGQTTLRFFESKDTSDINTDTKTSTPRVSNSNTITLESTTPLPDLTPTSIDEFLDRAHMTSFEADFKEGTNFKFKGNGNGHGATVTGQYGYYLDGGVPRTPGDMTSDVTTALDYADKDFDSLI